MRIKYCTAILIVFLFFHPTLAISADGTKLQKLVIGYAAPVASLAMIDVMKKGGLFRRHGSRSRACVYSGKRSSDSCHGIRASSVDVSRRTRESRYSGGHTAQTYGSYRAAGIDAIQLEFGTRLRARDNVDRTATDVAAAIRVFAKEYLPIKLEGMEPSIVTQP
jgi:hypothetical protein